MKKTITTITLAMVLTLGTTFANAGIIVAGKGSVPPKTEPCSQPTDKSLGGIIVAGFTGIIVAGFTGIIVAGKGDTAPVNCGIIVAGFDGIIVAG